MSKITHGLSFFRILAILTLMSRTPIKPEEVLLSDRLKAFWSEVESGRRTRKEFVAMEKTWLGEYAAIWTDAQKLPDEPDLPGSICREIQRVLELETDLATIEMRCRAAMLQMKEEWETQVSDGDEESVVQYYDRSENYPYELMWWHSLAEDQSPLAYVMALHLALHGKGRSYLDFGSGVGSGGLLFARHGFDVSLADISSTLLDFSRRRLDLRGAEAAYLDLKSESLPHDTYDFITAMDVFEHIAFPEKTAQILADSLRSGGILYGRFQADIDPDRPSHIAKDFEPMFELLADLGFSECWQDEWLWGHKAFRKP